jgi:protein MpaA
MYDNSAERIPRAQRGKVVNRFVQYGTSVLGAPLVVYVPNDVSPSILILAAHHGDEPETTVLLSTALRSVPPDQLKCAVVLAANPDGLARGTRGNAGGVDLNRNFPTTNWRPGPVLHCWFDDEPKSVELGTGDAPNSEPETKALLDLVHSISPAAIISIHSRLACVDDPNATPLAHWLSREMDLPLVRDIGYPTPGSFGTWASENAVPLITLELPDESIWTVRRKLGPVLETLLMQPDELIHGTP